MFGGGKNRNGCFDCDNCPRNNNPAKGRFCVAWWRGVEENVATGEVRPFEMCGFVGMQRLLDETAKASRSFASAVENSRDHVAHVMRGVVGQTIQQTVQAVREEMQLAYERHETGLLQQPDSQNTVRMNGS